MTRRSSAIGPHDAAQDMELAMEKMVGARHQHDRQILWSRPIQHGAKRNGGVVLAMNDEGAFRDRRQLVRRHRRADEDQLFWRDSYGEFRLHSRAKGEPGEQLALEREGLQHARQILHFAASAVMEAFAFADAAKIRPPRLVPEL